MESALGHFAIGGGEYHHFVVPKEPPLFTIAGGMKAEELPNARKMEYGAHIEFVLVKDEHDPFHLHGHVGCGEWSSND
jgi:iron transport multicopper oxidase